MISLCGRDVPGGRDVGSDELLQVHGGRADPMLGRVSPGLAGGDLRRRGNADGGDGADV